MEFQTKIPLQQQEHDQIDYNSKLLLLGSCFAESIGEKLNYFKFQSVVNPFGILFHPIAIENVITNALNSKTYTASDLQQHNEIYLSFDAHSRLSSQSESETLDALNEQIQKTNEGLKEASHLVITLGTAWVYRHIASDKIVANCHKIPQKQFLKELVPVDLIVESLNAIISLVKDVNPKCAILFTVSPIRHLKDGFVENNRSKGHLLSAVHEVVDPRHHIYYFPSYEIVMDELRDYRFYAEDMIHPNSTAISYIWKRFTETWMTEEACKVLQDVDAIQKGLNHKAFHQQSEKHQNFLNTLKMKKEVLSKQFPHISF